VILETRLPRDDEEARLFAIYEASRAKEHAAASQLLYPSRRLPHETYMKLIVDLRPYGRTATKKCSQSGRITIKWRRVATGIYPPPILDRKSCVQNSVKYETNKPTMKQGDHVKVIGTEKLTLRHILSVRCPVCRAKPKEKCTLSTGHPCVKTHHDRSMAAAKTEAARPLGGPLYE